MGQREIEDQQKTCRIFCVLARLSSVRFADFFARKDLGDFLLEALLDFLANDSRILCVIFYRILN
jgi:hypothetical protein